MSNLSYNEAAARALLKCAREHRSIAVEILDSVTEQPIPASEDTLRWAVARSAVFANRANELEREAQELTFVEPRVLAATHRSIDAHIRAINLFDQRARRDGSGPLLAGLLATA